MTTGRGATPRDAMYELSGVGIPDADLLDAVIRRHPDHAADLTEFAIELALDALRTDEPAEAAEAIDIGPSAAVSRAMSRFQNKLHEVRSAAGAPSGSFESRAAANPFADLDRAAFREVAARIGVSTVFAVKMRDRQIDPGTMTDGFRRHVADGLKAPLGVVVAHFAAIEGGAARQYYRADVKPSGTSRQTFAEAVAASGLSEEQKAALLKL